ncbi:D-alanyl-D-alanine carboxypeptidase [Microvirga thermotolerans]|uniref:D-alanyl-D-alanine carboxypeptidase n=1 Tax=Microvirga thermotolerans TaxID=2651334 RepID=A0A5P9JYG8_9HYPH|nr:D-alanyl-D-alanine carboxypeptidase [Microvirga thermotolerans]QFU16686.1 D-alanyl-D-alanine carboxypeptidase [Microvirga thermotolerans]
MNSVRAWVGPWVGRRKWVALVGVAASVAVAFGTPAEAARRKSRGGGYSPPYASIVVDAKTGRILEGENVDAPRIPASITKVMTLYLLFEQLERGRLRLDSPLTVSEYAASQAPTKLGLRPGSTIEVEDAIKAMVTLSANDVSVVVAENLAGSEDAFARQMTRKARELGMNSTTFYNPHGLPHSPPNITTARDLSVLGRAIQDRFPKYFPYFQTTSFQYGSRTIRGHNRLLGRVEGVDGIKTGYTRLSGFNLLTSVNTDTRSIVAVVLGGRSAALRDRQMAALIEEHLPRAYAGARTAPPVTETAVAAQPAAQPVVVADASPSPSVKVEAAAAPEPAAPPPPARKPLDLNSLRPVVASAAGASTTTTPSSGSQLRWQKGPQALPANTQAYAAVETDTGPSDREKAALLAKIEKAAPATTASAAAPVKTAALKAEAPEPKPAARPAVTGWVIQLGATDDEDKAKAMLDAARAKSGRLLAKASPFTEKVVQKGATLYRARFSGFEESEDAERACKALKKSGFACFAARSS